MPYRGKRRRRGIIVEFHPTNDEAPSGAAYSEDVAPDGAWICFGRQTTKMSRLRRWNSCQPHLPAPDFSSCHPAGTGIRSKPPTHKMRTKTGITLQEAHELNQFVEHLQTGAITTAELKSALMTLRQNSDSGVLWEWANSIAHKRRDKGKTFQAGANLWLERFQIYSYFSRHPDLERIPIPIFETLVNRIKHEDEQTAGSLVYMYRKLDKANVYALDHSDINTENAEDLLRIQKKIPELERTNWSGPPFAFKTIVNEIATEFQRLINVGKRKITKHKDLLALHFLCAFHLTEIALEHFKDPGTRCYLSLDSNEGKLCLNLALYQLEKGVWKQLDISDGTYNRYSGWINHCYSRPFLVTGLSERKYCPEMRSDLFQHAMGVKTNWIRKYIGRV